MSNPIGDPGHGHSPGGMDRRHRSCSSAFTIGTLAFFFDRAVAGVGLRGPARRRRARRLGHVQGRLRRQRLEVTPKEH